VARSLSVTLELSLGLEGVAVTVDESLVKAVWYSSHRSKRSTLQELYNSEKCRDDAVSFSSATFVHQLGGSGGAVHHGVTEPEPERHPVGVAATEIKNWFRGELKIVRPATFQPERETQLQAQPSCEGVLDGSNQLSRSSWLARG
jgi:hypothetical protein